MQPLPQFARALTKDFVIVGMLGGMICWIASSPQAGLGFLCGGLWLALNIASLSWSIAAYGLPGGRGKLLFTLALCAKIPVAYLILLWLVSNAYMKPIAVVAALATLPVVLLFEGLAGRSARVPGKNFEDGS